MKCVQHTPGSPLTLASLTVSLSTVYHREPFVLARKSLEDSGICPVFQTAISYNPKVPESTLEETPLCVFAPRSQNGQRLFFEFLIACLQRRNPLRRQPSFFVGFQFFQAPRSWATIQYKKLTAEYLALTDSDKGKEG